MNNPNKQFMNYMPPCMQMQGMMPMQYEMMPMMEDENDEELERMYPKTYYMIMPVVNHHCDMMFMKHGMHHRPSREEVEEMVESIYKDMRDDFNDMEDDESSDDEMRQYRPRRRFLRDLIGVLFINELLNRRRRRRPYYPGYGY